MVQLRTLIVSFIVVTACGLQADEFAVTGPVTVVRVCRGDSAIVLCQFRQAAAETPASEPDVISRAACTLDVCTRQSNVW